MAHAHIFIKKGNIQINIFLNPIPPADLGQQILSKATPAPAFDKNIARSKEKLCISC